MSVGFRYTPPKVNAAVLVRAAAEEAAQLAGEHILAAANELVPVDTGALQASGHVVKEDGAQVAIVYGAEDGAGRNGQDTAAYAVPQHERLDFEHPNGQAKFLETPLHSEAAAVAQIVATTVGKAFR